MEQIFKSVHSLNRSKRWDYRFHQQEFSDLESKLEKTIYPLYSVKEITEQVIDGTHFTPQYTDNSGVLFLMARNVRPFEINLDNVAYITKEEHQKLIRCKPEPGDVLVTKDGTIGVAAVVPDYLPEFNIFVSVIKVRPCSIVSSQYLAAFFNSELGQLQIKQQVKGASITHIHLEDIRRLKVPIHPRSIQDRIAQVMQNAYAARREKTAEAGRLYQEIDKYVLGELGIDIVQLQSQRRVLKSIQFIAGRRFDFDAVVTLQNIDFGLIEAVFLKEIVKQSNNRVTPVKELPHEYINYIGLGNITSHIGDLGDFSPVKGEQILSSSPTFNQGDILFGRMRPYLNKVWLAEFDGVCSGEVVVLKPNKQKVDPRFLQTLLLSQVTLNQVLPLQSGTSLPRVSASDILSIKLPIPQDLYKQVEIGDEISRRRAEAKRLRAEAENLVIQAKARVEQMILGEKEVA